MKIEWRKARSERYCVDSGVPVAAAGDRCRRHGGARERCYTALRDPRCQHPKLSPNHPYPRCEDCGNIGTLPGDPHVG